MEILDAAGEGRRRGEGEGADPGHVSEPTDSNGLTTSAATRATTADQAVPKAPRADSADLVMDLGLRTGTDPSGESLSDRSRPQLAGRWRRASAHVVGALLSAEALGLSALVLELTALTGGHLVVRILSTAAGTNSGSPYEMIDQCASGVQVFALPALVLAVAGLLRLREDSPDRVCGIVGAALIVAVLLLVTTAYLMWQASALPADPTPPTGTG
jgi:hypothetical protein